MTEIGLGGARGRRAPRLHQVFQVVRLSACTVHTGFLDGDVLLLDVLLDGDVLLLEGGVLLARVHFCLQHCSSVRLKISWKCPVGIRVHEFAPERSGELVNVVDAV